MCACGKSSTDVPHPLDGPPLRPPTPAPKGRTSETSRRSFIRRVSPRPPCGRRGRSLYTCDTSTL